MSRRAFPLVFAKDVQASAFFYQRFGFVRHAQNPPTGEPTFVGLRRDDAEIAVVDLHWPRERYAGTVGESPRFEFFVFVDDVDATLAELEETGIQILRSPIDMPWGERIAYVSDPDGNPVALASEVPVVPVAPDATR